MLSSSLRRLRDVVDVVSDAGAAASACRDRDEDAREVVDLNFFPMNVIAILYWMSYRSTELLAGGPATAARYGGMHRTSSLSLSRARGLSLDK